MSASAPLVNRHPERRVMIVAGEASGDLHGADLVREMLALDPSIEIFGIAGVQMRAAGAKALVRMEAIHGLGLTELASTIGKTAAAMRALRRILRDDPPDVLILIDYAEFNLVLSGVARRAGVPVLYYITPQVWAWRRGRVKKIVARATRLAVVLPFEKEIFDAAGGRAVFVGHPLLDRVKVAQDRAATLARHGLPRDARLIALLPGSRQAEIRYILPPMTQAARILAHDHNLTPVLAVAPTIEADSLAQTARADLDGIKLVSGDTYSIVAASEVALVASGTATLETALLGCPEVVAYKVTPLTYMVGRLLVTGVTHIAMPNILAGRTIVPELIQNEVTAQNLVRAAEPMLSASMRREVVAALVEIRAKLGTPGAAARVAQLAIEMSSTKAQ